MINWVKDLPEESWAIMPDGRILIEEDVFNQIKDYSGDMSNAPTGLGHIYRTMWQNNRNEIGWLIWMLVLANDGLIRWDCHEVETIGTV